jgi:ATP-dependent Clp protease protease subunit
MASVVLMAATKELRFSAPHASFCIHEPRFPAYSIDTDATATMLSQLSEELRIETQRFIDLYVERTGTDADTIARVMSEDRVIDAEEALSLGIVGAINTPNTALSNQPKNNIMSKKNAIARLLEQAKALLSGAVAELRLTTTSGAELVVETDADDPRVGDPATPDGEHTLEDGRVVVVTDGVITEIRERTEETITEEEVQAMADTIESLTAEVERLRKENATLLETQRTAEEKTIVEMVAKSGGLDWLKTVAVSTRTATQRVQTQSTQAQGLSLVERKLADLKSRNNKQ